MEMEMKKHLMVIAAMATGLFAGMAHADDKITLYGVIDAAVRTSTNARYDTATGKSGNFTGFSQGLFNGSRFGIKGAENLGDGLKAIYTVEAGFILGNGLSDQQGQLFSRQAWVGLSDETLGTLTAGRQYGILSDAIGTGDIFGEKHGNEIYAGTTNTTTATPNQGDTVSENGFAYGITGYRWDNSLIYAKDFGINQDNHSKIKFSLMYAFMGQGGSNTLGANPATSNGVSDSMSAAELGYASDDFSASVGYQQEINGGSNTNAAVVAAGAPANPTHTNIGVGANFMYGEKNEFGARNGVYAYFLQSKLDIGFQRIGGTDSGFNYGTGVAPSGTLLLSSRQDQVISVSTNYYVIPRLNLLAAYFRDGASSVPTPAAPTGASGARNGVILTADYYLSKDTDTYLTFAHTVFSGALVGNPLGGNATNGNTSTMGVAGAPSTVNTVMLGLRHRF
jgi:predicted porin